MRSLRIGAGQGFYGDTPTGALAVAERGDVRYICCDALAELTMAILMRDRARSDDRGYARDLPDFVRTLLPACRKSGIRIITNAGGVNPTAAAAAVCEVARDAGATGLRVAAVTGDELTSRLGDLSGDNSFANLDTGEPYSAVAGRLAFAVAYLGIEPILEALRQDADVIVTGRVADASLFLAPMVHELGWALDDWDRLASGVVAGHLMECSAQSTGGNFSGDWRSVPDVANIGYPVAEIFEDGSAQLSKPKNTGGLVSVDTVKEQLLYEVLDPSSYMNPDVVADFTSVTLNDVAENVVGINGIKGRPRPETLKVIGGYLDGWLGVASIGYAWPDAHAKAQRAAEIIDKLASNAGLHAMQMQTEYIGIDSAHGGAAPVPADINEVTLRVAGRFRSESEAAAFSRIATPLALNGPPFISGGSPPQRPRALLGVWPTLVRRQDVPATVEVMTA